MNRNPKLSSDINQNKSIIKNYLPIKKSFDLIGRELIIGQSIDAYLLFIDGFAKDDIMLWILDILQSLPENKISNDIIETLIKENRLYRSRTIYRF